MGEQEQLVRRLQDANAALIEAVRSAPSAGWLHPVGDGDPRSAGTLAHHIGAGYEHGLDWAMSIQAKGLMPEISMASVNAENAEHAAAFAYPPPAQVIAFLETECAELCAFAMSLSDLELDAASSNFVMGRQWTPRDVFETTLNHTRRHHRQFVQAVTTATA